MAKKNKNNFLGFRLADKNFNKLEMLAKQEGKSRGVLAKETKKSSNKNGIDEVVIIMIFILNYL